MFAADWGRSQHLEYVACTKGHRWTCTKQRFDTKLLCREHKVLYQWHVCGALYDASVAATSHRLRQRSDIIGLSAIRIETKYLLSQFCSNTDFVSSLPAGCGVDGGGPLEI